MLIVRNGQDGVPAGPDCRLPAQQTNRAYQAHLLLQVALGEQFVRSFDIGIFINAYRYLLSSFDQLLIRKYIYCYSQFLKTTYILRCKIQLFFLIVVCGLEFEPDCFHT
jgi:hypothetical protein